jgi:hypothetical protein
MLKEKNRVFKIHTRYVMVADETGMFSPGGNKAEE